MQQGFPELDIDIGGIVGRQTWHFIGVVCDLQNGFQPLCQYTHFQF